MKLTIIMVTLILAQSLLIAGLLIVGGVLKQIKENAYMTFDRMVNNRTVYLQGEMLNRWSNIAPYAEQITEKLPLLNGKDQEKNKKDFFESIEETMVSMMRITKATDSFVLLNDDQPGTNQHSALYFRDDDPLLNNMDNSDICLLAGPAEFTERYASIEDWWNYKITLNEGNESFYTKPYEAAALKQEPGLLGYWSRPFCLNQQDSPRITYSQPLMDEEGKVYGVIGIGLSVSYMNQSLPAGELTPKDSLGYMLGYQIGKKGQIQPMLLNGAYQKRILYEDAPLDMQPKDKKTPIYLLKNHKSKKVIYACPKGLSLYQPNTPFEEENWYVIGLQEEDQLLNLLDRVEKILFYSLLAAIALGVLCGGTASFGFARPIIKLSQQVRKSNPLEETVFEKTGLSELDDLAEAIENGNRSIAESAKKLRWERDYDSLTQLCGRRLFRSSVTQLLEQGDLCVAAMVMMDLDYFKGINDAYGHAWGDTYLKEVARELTEMSSNGCIVGRRSGDEFFVFFYDFQSKEEIRLVLRELYHGLERNPLEFPDGSRKSIQISAGIAWVQEQEPDFDKLLDQADTNLYKVKNNQRGTFGEG